MRNDTMSVSTMPRAKSSKSSKIKLNPQEVECLLRVGVEFMDTVESILESRGAYNQEFLDGLQLSSDQAKKNKLKKIGSLAELGD
jgi:hypothetical protein